MPTGWIIYHAKDPDTICFGGIVNTLNIGWPTRSERNDLSEDKIHLTKKRMETIDDETGAAAWDFIDRAHKDGKPFFYWYNTTHMHFRTHAKPESHGQSGQWQSEYRDVIIDHDKNVGEMLAKLDKLGIAADTIVFYSTDNGPHMTSWPDAGMTPFRSEKNTNWEGAFRVPGMVRWPGKIKAGAVSNQMISHLDWLPTILAAAGEPDIKEKFLKGHQVGGKTFKVHSAQSGQGRLAPVRPQLLLALPAGRAPAADDRHRHEPYRISLHGADRRRGLKTRK